MLRRFAQMIVLISLTAVPLSLAADGTTARILCLFSYHSGHEWEDSILEDMIPGLKERLPGTELYLEFMDTKRYTPESRRDQVLERLGQYPSDFFSLIMAVDDNALQLLADEQDLLFPGVPVVFCGVNGYDRMKPQLHENVTGVISRVNLAATAAFARSLIPELKTIYVIADATPTGEGNREMILDQLKDQEEFPEDLTFRFVGGLDYSTVELLDWSAGLPADTALLMTSWYMDRLGEYIGEKEFIARLRMHTAVPVFNLLHIRPGLLGGRVTAGPVQSQLAVDMAVRILGGESASDIPVIREDTSIYVADYERLRYWGFRVPSLPEETRLLNPSAYYQYRYQIIILAGIFLLLTGLIIALILLGIRLLRTGRNLARQKDELYITLSSIGDAVISTDSHSRVVFMNNVAEELTGWPMAEASGRDLSEVFPIANARTGEAVDNPVRRVLTSGQVVGLADHTILNSRDGQVYHIADSAAPIRERSSRRIRGVVLVFRDITDSYRTQEALRNSREQLRQAARMEAVGKLAGGIAHEFNNLLQIIMGYGQILREEAGGQDTAALVDPILKTAASARNLTRQLLLFSRKETADTRTISLSRLMHSLIPILKRLLEENIRLESELAGGEDWFLGDSQQIEQVVINLSLNARDAMPGGGILELSQDTVSRSSGFPGLEGNIPAGNYVHLSVRDNGTGIDGKILPEIFDPFFTTKKREKGTGLGLSIVYGIIRQHKGYISIETEPATGTVFHIYLPRTEPPEEEPEQAETPGKTAGAGGTIYLAEDDPMVRRLTETMIRKAGYNTRSFINGRELIDNLDKHFREEEPIRLFILDVIMPEMGGEEVYRILRERGISTPVLFISGYTDERLKDLRFLRDAELLHKPFTAKELEKAVSGMIRT